MVFFPNEKLELWTYTESTTEFNSYLEPKKIYTLSGTVDCDFQVMSNEESLREFGEVRADTYKIYLDSNVSVDASMILRLKGKTDTYEIVGTPIDNNHLTPVKHKKLVVIKQRKPTKLIEPVQESGNND